MGKNFSPRGRLERREQQDLSLFSGVTPRETKCHTESFPGQHGGRGSKLSSYGKQFRAKQMAKRMYGLLERQFRGCFKKAAKHPGSTGEHLLRMLECRLDNVVYRLGFARTRKEARQLITHKGVVVNNGKVTRVVNIPSYQVIPGNEVLVREKCRKQGRIQEALEISKQRSLSEWLEAYPEEFKGVMKRVPDRSEMPNEINELLIVELYSK